jgi:transcription elongation factor GreA
VSLPTPGCGRRPGLDAAIDEAEQVSDQMIEEIRERMVREIEQLNHELHVVLPEALQRARELGDLRENGDYQAAIERQQFVQARLNHLRDRLSRLSSIDLSKVPRDRVGLGSIVTVLDLETNDREIFELVIPDAMDLDEGHISVSSPLGRALLDLKVGDETGVRLPFGTRRLRIEKLQTIHAQLKTKSEKSPPNAAKPKRRPKAKKKAKKKG